MRKKSVEKRVTRRRDCARPGQTISIPPMNLHCVPAAVFLLPCAVSRRAFATADPIVADYIQAAAGDWNTAGRRAPAIVPNNTATDKFHARLLVSDRETSRSPGR